jgi:hypothetical protein
MQVITAAEVKTLLGLTGTTYDAAIALKIPIIDSTVKRLTKNKYHMRIVGTITTDSDSLSIARVYNYRGDIFNSLYDNGWSIDEILTVGQMIEGEGIPAGAFIQDIDVDSVLDTIVPSITMSADATATGAVTVTTGIPHDLKQIIAKGIWWLMDNDSTVIKDDTWTSRSLGPASVSRGADAERIHPIAGMPMWFVKAFPQFQGGY